MESRSDLPPRYSLVLPEITTYHDRVVEFLQRVDLSPPECVPILPEPSPVDFQASNSIAAEVRSLLIQQRTSEPGYRKPETQTRHIFRTKSRRESKCNEENWAFTKHEVGKAFDSLLSRKPLAEPAVAQALLSHAPKTSLDKLWCHFQDPKLEKRMNSRFRRSRSSVIAEPTWLNEVTAQENLDYIRLLCCTGFTEDVLDKAFGIALRQKSMESMALLLRYGAAAIACKEIIRDHVKLGDVPLARLLLAAPHAMTFEAWEYCLEPDVGSLKDGSSRCPNILLLCLAHHPEVVSDNLLLLALEAQNFQATGIMLAYAGPGAFDDIHHPACELVSLIPDSDQRYSFFAIFAACGFLEDGLVLCEELLKDVKARHFPLIKLLVDADISLDVEPHNAVNWAVLKMDLELLELLKGGKFASPVNFVLGAVPQSASEPDMIRLLDMFASRGLSGEPLDLHLIRAVTKQHAQLTEKLLQCGASIEYSGARCVKEALEKVDFKILSILLQNPCSRQILSTTIPNAMAISSRSSRLHAMKALVEKGITKQELGLPLQTLVSEDGDVDTELIQILLQYQAPVDGVGDEAKSAVPVAARRGNLTVLKMVCQGGPQVDTLSKTVPIAFATINSCGYEVAYAAIELLLEKGATGLPVHQTLLMAAKQDHRLGIARLLVAHGAEANFSTGASFAVALETNNFNLLQLLCNSCPPSQASLESLLYTATNPQYYNLEALELLLGSSTSSAAALNAAWSSDKFKGNPNMTAIVPCLLRHGLSVDLDGGEILCFAIRDHNIKLLTRILSAGPRLSSLEAAFGAAVSIKNLDVALVLISLLLDKAESAEIGQSKALRVAALNAVSTGDNICLRLLLQHNASVDFNGGIAVKAVAALGARTILGILLDAGASPSTINGACLAAAASDPEDRQNVFKDLLAANGGMLAEEMDRLLADAVAKLPQRTQLPTFLLNRHARVKLETLGLALKTSSHELFTLLANHIPSINIPAVFREAIKMTMSAERRYWIYQDLLNRGIHASDVSSALIKSLQGNDLGDLSLQKLLLQYGAAVGHKKSEAFALALQAKSLGAVRLLSQYIEDDNSAALAFEHARRTSSLTLDERLEVYRFFLPWNLDQSSVYLALVQNLESSPNEFVVRFLLEKGANPNKDNARCFALASKAKAEAEFRALSKFAKLSVVLKALMLQFKEEWEVTWWFNLCLEEQPHSAKIEDDGLLFQSMTKFPHGGALVRVLIDNGVSASTKKTLSLCPGWQAEPCTPLVWALFSKPRIENDAIIALLTRCDQDLPTYKTPKTNVSAAFGCLLDKTRIPVLKALLELDRDHVLSSTVPGSSFLYLGAYPKPTSASTVIKEDLPLWAAALHLANFDAFRLLGGGEKPDDGTLHMAAGLALPRFVDWLLDFHHPNYKAEHMGNLIPLALVCKAEPNPWCKFADDEGDFRSRQRETIRLLAKETDLKWRLKGMTVLHFALQSGIEVTRLMIDALDIRNDPGKDENYLYLDKDGLEYSPHQWVMKCQPGIADLNRKALIECLLETGMKSRYFRRVKPGAGTQPQGFHGLPLDYEIMWDAKD